MSTTKFISYLRKSTKNKASQKKHSFDTQLGTIKNFVSQAGGEIVAIYRESHSGMDENRPELKRALEMCEKTGATLIVASLCRLSRSINQVNNLFHSSIKIVVCEYGMEVSMETILLMSVLNQLEVEKMSRRIKAGMATAKAKGKVFGQNARANQPKATAMARLKAMDDLTNIWPVLYGLRAQGFTWEEVAYGLNGLGLKTPRGKKWTLHQARYLYLRGEKLCK